MANKYLIEGATYCGDGTASNEAASAGAAGAWNNINVFEGTAPAYGTLAAGDVVYIRSKTSAGAAITRTLAANVSLGASAATAANPIVWKIDNAGVVWSGVTGVITYIYLTATTGYTLTFSANNFIVAGVPDGIVAKSTKPDGSDTAYVVNNGYVENLLHDLSLQTGVNNYSSPFSSQAGSVTKNLHYLRYRPGYSSNNTMITSVLGHGVITYINPRIEILNPTVNGNAVFKAPITYQVVNIFGGEVFGAGATSNQALVYTDGYSGAANYAIFTARGLQYPNTMNVFDANRVPIGAKMIFDISGADGGAGAHYETGWGYVTSRSDNYPPTLSGELPDGDFTKWAWRMYPRNTAFGTPGMLDFCLYSQGATASKTVSIEFLAESGFSPRLSNTWIDVSYTDENGSPKTDTTWLPESTTACETSSANWSATTWGISSFNKYKLSLVTSGSVKEGTLVTVGFRTLMKSASSLQVLFIDSEFSVT